MTNSSQYETAVLKVRERNIASTHLLRIYLGLTYREAQDFIEQMERDGHITAPLANGTRKVIDPIKKPKPVYSAEQLLGSG